MDLAQRIQVAMGNGPVDLLLTNGRLMNVFSGEIHPAAVAIHGGRIVGLGEYDATEIVDLEGRYISPGFIDGHIHLESSMLSIPEFARNVVPQGTTAVVADPHEIANVMGVDGVRFMLDSSEGQPLRVFLMFPSCVPATPFETSGARLTDKDMEPFKDHARVLGLAEVMNFPGVMFADPEILAKMSVFRHKVIDGHAPGLSGKGLNAYVGAGIGSDHECTAREEALDKLRLGMRVMIREGSAARNLDVLLPLVTEKNSRHCFFVTDDMEPHTIQSRGHIKYLVKTAVAKGVDPVTAVQMASLNAAQYFGLKRLGAVAPGYEADLLILDDLTEFNPWRVYQGGRLAAESGRMIVPCRQLHSNAMPETVRVDWQKAGDLSLAAKGPSIRVIEVVPGQIFTRHAVHQAKIADGKVVSDPDRDILKMAVIERHNATGSVGIGFIKGFGLKSGAMASTVAHDSHNILVVGVTDEDMLAAAREAARMQGGYAVVDQGKVLASLPLPVAGLMSDRPLEEVSAALTKVSDCARKLGCPLAAPFATLSFMALTPIPELKLTDQGLFDSVNFAFVDLFAQ